MFDPQLDRTSSFFELAFHAFSPAAEWPLYNFLSIRAWDEDNHVYAVFIRCFLFYSFISVFVCFHVQIVKFVCPLFERINFPKCRFGSLSVDIVEINREGRLTKLHRKDGCVTITLSRNFYHAPYLLLIERRSIVCSGEQSSFTSPMIKQGAPLRIRHQWLIALIANYFNARLGRMPPGAS